MVKAPGPDQSPSDRQPKKIPLESGGFVLLPTSLAGPHGRRVEVLLLYEGADINCRFRLLTTPDYMKVFLHYTKLRPNHIVTVEQLRQHIETSGDIRGIDGESLSMLADTLNNPDEEVGPFEIARGAFPQPGEDGRLEFLVRPTSDEPQYEIDEAGTIDYRQLNLFENVVAGQEVAKTILPTAGKPGMDVLGRPIEARDGNPITVHGGGNISVSEDNLQFFATEDGRIIFQDGLLFLTTVYEVDGDVDYSVGNIDFIGEVLIKGAVLDEFQVIGCKGVTVNGLISNCLVKSDGDVKALGGMAGRGEGKIVAGGNVFAKYLNDTIVEADGDVEVEKEIVGSNVRSTGQVRIPRGTIIGGQVIAFRGVEAGNIGSDLGVSTHVTAGVKWTAEKQMAQLDETIDKTKERIHQISDSLSPMLSDRSLLLTLTPEQKKVLRDLLSQLRRLRDELNQAREERVALMGYQRQGQISQINVNALLHPGVAVRLPHLRMSLRNAFRGPLSIIEDLENDRVCILKGFPLSEDYADQHPWRDESMRVQPLK